MDQSTYDNLRRIIYRESGIVLDDGNGSFVLSRLQGRLIELNISRMSDYLQILLDDKGGEELTKLIDLVTTNTTSFYRETHHFQLLRKYLTDISRSGQKEIKVWSAAASTGEEPYTLCFEALECLDPIASSFRILATDISTRALGIASRGVYSMEAARGIPETLRRKYLESLTLPEGEFLRVRKSVRSHVMFKRFNLARFPFVLQGPIDAVFFRNVMIYFDLATRQGIVDEVVRLLRPHGMLVIGVTENLLGVNHPLKKIDTSVFIKGG